MKKNRNIKNIIKKRIEINTDRKKFIPVNSVKKRVNSKVSKIEVNDPIIKPKKVVKIVDRNSKLINKKAPLDLGKHQKREFLRTGSVTTIVKNVKEINFRDYGEYKKKARVDYDVVFCVSSFNRYEKIERILNQLFSQETKYTFKFILMNDGSLDKRYDELKFEYPDIIYLKNKVGGGKVNYWKTINKMWDKLSRINTHAMIQLDDDFILCDNFLNILLDKFFEVKEKSNNYMVFGFHIYNFKIDQPADDWWFDENIVTVDGGMLFDVQFLEKINYKLDGIEDRVTIKTSSFTWVRIKERLIEFGMKVYRLRNSLVWHDGNDDSQLHPTIRKIKRVYTKNFIDIDKVNYEQ